MSTYKGTEATKAKHILRLYYITDLIHLNISMIKDPDISMREKKKTTLKPFDMAFHSYIWSPALRGNVAHYHNYLLGMVYIKAYVVAFLGNGHGRLELLPF